ncbi:nitrogen fixation protein NifX [Desulfuromonas versatilis]|uniref:Nitrogen fixation protein NifX n=1 Tax=Desulfuromonas versatilis TaxID=2802975 RepID=A0ABM8I1G0_9BACT|nr:nitrogen fixation protein NifX [Desulfuromonas versatilis]BCR06547.1 nitrogen fixation protein NifX [Desulfuromonas versatilis]
MIRTRRFDIIGGSTRKGLAMKVAFASTDKVHIDGHFGQAEEFYIWNIGPEEASFAGVVQVQAEAEMGHSDDKIEARGAALADCALVYVAEIGGPAAARLVAKRIHPLKSKDREPITDVIAKLQEVLKGNPPPWLRKAMLKSERPGFADN